MKAMMFAGILGLVLCKAYGQSKAEETEGRVRARLSGFWQAMQDADYAKAMAFVQPDSRRAFDKLPRTRVNKFRISSLTFNSEYTECDSVTIVSKPSPGFGAVFDWPLQNHWFLQEGEWYLGIPWGENDNPMLEVFKQMETVSKVTKPLEGTPPSAPRDRTGGIKTLTEAVGRLKPDRLNPGVVHFGEKAIFRFNFSNEGKSPIRILSAHSDCHCTGVQSEYPDVPPGQTGTLEVTLDTFGQPMGKIEKHVTVQFSDLSFPVDLPISIENLPNYRVMPASVDFGAVRMGMIVEKSVRIINDSGRTVKIVSRLKSDPRMEVSVTRDNLAPGAELNILLRYDPVSPGEFLDTIMLYTDLPAEPIINIPVKGVIKP